MAGRTPEETGDLIGEAMKRKDLDGALDLFEPEAVFVDPSSGQQMHGHDEIRQALVGFMEVDAQLLPSPPPTILVSGDVALVLAPWTLEVAGEDGQPVRQSGQATDVLRRQADGTWRFVIDNPAGVELPGG